jgi:hypothetical protein
VSRSSCGAGSDLEAVLLVFEAVVGADQGGVGAAFLGDR